jgi:Lon protease-like protein
MGPAFELGMFPLSTVLFPGAMLPLHVFEPRYRSLMADCLSGGRRFGVVLITRGSEVGGGDERVDVGTVARIEHIADLEGGRLLAAVRGERRIRVEEWLPDEPYPRAVVVEAPVEGAGPGDAEGLRAAERAVRRVRSLLSELGDVPAVPPDLRIEGSPEETAWLLCDLAPLNLVDRQQLLAAATLSERLGRLEELCEGMARDVVAVLAGGTDP